MADSPDVLDEIRALDHEERRELAELLAESVPDSGPTRRQVGQAIGALGLGTLLGGGGYAAATEQARAAPSTTDGDGDVGSPSSPVDAWLDGIGATGSPVDVEERIAMAEAIEYNHVVKSTSFTVADEQVVVMDSSIASLTASIPASEETPGRVLVFLDGGDASTNKWTVDPNSGINGQASVDVQFDRAVLVVWWNDNAGEWRSNQYVDTINARSITTDEASITNETFVRGTRSSETSSISSATRTNIVDGESKDNRNEFNSSQEFVPDKTGQYEVTGVVHIGGSTSTGDEIFVDIRADGASSVRTANYEAPGNQRRFNFNFKPELSSGTAYTVTAYNNNSSFTINTDTFVEFVWSVVQ